MAATPGILHLTNDPSSHLTLCGEPLDECWTDAIGEIIDEGPSDSVCAECFKLGKKELEQLDRDDSAWRSERAMEAGMLHGIDAYNEERGCPLTTDDSEDAAEERWARRFSGGYDRGGRQ